MILIDSGERIQQPDKYTPPINAVSEARPPDLFTRIAKTEMCRVVLIGWNCVVWFGLFPHLQSQDCVRAPACIASVMSSHE